MNGKLLLSVAVAATFALSACEAPAESGVNPPARVVPVEGGDLNRVILSDEAAQRIGVETAPVVTSGSDRVAIPAAAVVYDADGATWVYTEVAPLTFVRQRVTIAEVRDGVAVLRSGPLPGVQVVTVGAAELLGSEYGVQGE